MIPIAFVAGHMMATATADSSIHTNYSKKEGRTYEEKKSLRLAQFEIIKHRLLVHNISDEDAKKAPNLMAELQRCRRLHPRDKEDWYERYKCEKPLKKAQEIWRTHYLKNLMDEINQDMERRGL